MTRLQSAAPSHCRRGIFWPTEETLFASTRPQRREEQRFLFRQNGTKVNQEPGPIDTRDDILRSELALEFLSGVGNRDQEGGQRLIWRASAADNGLAFDDLRAWNLHGDGFGSGSDLLRREADHM